MKDWDLAESLFKHQQLSPQKIAETTNLPVQEVHDRIYGQRGWMYELNHSPEITCEEFELMSPVVLTHLKMKGLEIIKKGMDGYNTENMSMKDVKDATDVLISIDKIDRLDKGKATTITTTEIDRMDAKEIIEARRTRSDYIEADYEVVDD